MSNPITIFLSFKFLSLYHILGVVLILAQSRQVSKHDLSACLGCKFTNPFEATTAEVFKRLLGGSLAWRSLSGSVSNENRYHGHCSSASVIAWFFKNPLVPYFTHPHHPYNKAAPFSERGEWQWWNGTRFGNHFATTNWGNTRMGGAWDMLLWAWK